jgi:hypothetical protein
MLDRLTAKGFEVETTAHATAILNSDFGAELIELETALDRFSLNLTELIEGGGGEAPFTQRLRRELTAVGWIKHNFVLRKIIDGEEREATSHEMDHIRRTVKGVLALEIEWNNKAEFYDRDLENFKRLHSEGVFSVAILITRGKSFQDNIGRHINEFVQIHQVQSFDDLVKFKGYDPSRKFVESVNRRVAQSGQPFRDVWAREFVASKYAATTTHWEKLQERIKRGVGNPCPMLLIGIPDTIITQ